MPNLADRIRTAEFPVVRKGYDPDAVARFLSGVAQEVGAVEDAARAEGVRVRRLERQLTEIQNIGSDPSAVFLSATEAKERLLADAQVRAEEILASARDAANHDNATDPVLRALEEAEIIEAAARTLAARVVDDAKRKAAEIISSASSPDPHQPPRRTESLQQYG